MKFEDIKISVTRSNFEDIKEFHDTFGVAPDPTTPTVIDKESLRLRAELIFEETQEVFEELGIDITGFDSDGLALGASLVQWDKEIDLHKLAKELADLLYVVYGTAAAFGIPIDDVFKAVHASNMSKLDKDGKVLRREDGKVLKSERYQPPDLKKVF